MRYLSDRERKRLVRRRVLTQTVVDILLVGVILPAFAFFHHALPAIQADLLRQELLSATTPAPEPTTPAPATTAPPPETTLPGDTTPPETTPPPTEPDNRTPWQIQFEDHFTEEIVRTDMSYTSPNVSITIEQVIQGEGADQILYYVADIYIASMENFVTHTANNRMVYFDTQDVLEMDKASDAILAISGDFLTYQNHGLMVRNGQIYKADNSRSDICVLYPDGTMQTYMAQEYEVADILAGNPLQVWQFGPELLDEKGQVKDNYVVSTAVSYPNPRSAVGYYEPGHYCFVVVDGRKEGHSKGMRMKQLAQVFADLGCTAAYNLDGGGSAVMTFNDKKLSRQSNGGRELGDILLIRDVPPA